MRCPTCGDEYAGDPPLRCVECGTPLDGSGGPPELPLGIFHPGVAPVVLQLARHRGFDARPVPVDDGTEIRVAASGREPLRAELVATWPAIVADLEPDLAGELRRMDVTYPGWSDPPESTWVDRDGRLRVSAREDDRAADEARALGPALIAIGLILLLVAVWAGPGGLRLLSAVGGLGMVLVGLFNPR
ncbi:MAG: hypothetical protein ACRDUY_05225 [Nitriliruptorales bacterium]